MAEKPTFGSSISGDEKSDRPEKPASGAGGALQEGRSGSGARREAEKKQIGGQVGGIGGTTPQHGRKDLPGGAASRPAKRNSGCFGSVLAIVVVLLLASALR